MQFLNPIWLFGISGILIPIIIHLWNIKSGKVLKVGSIMLMGESSRENSRSLKLQDYLLLLMRCLIIVFISLLLAEPVLKSEKSEPSNGWILISRSDLSKAYNSFKPEIDSLLKAGHEFHFFEPGFPKADLTEYLEKPQDTSDQSELSFWSLTRVLNETAPLDIPINIYSNRLMEYFKGSRAIIPQHISWKTYAPSVKHKTGINSAWLTNNDSIGVLLAHADTSMIRHQLIKISSEGKHTDLKLSLHKGQPAVSLTQEQGAPDRVIVDTSSIRIGIYSEKYPADIRYLKAALAAVRDFTGRKIVIDDLSETEPTSVFNLIFWLSEKSIPVKIAGNKETAIFTYSKGKTVSVNSQIRSSDFSISAKSNPIDLFKKISQRNDTSEPGIWQDASGKPVLSRKTISGQTVYEFYSRFNPDWSELVWSAQFPELLLPIIFTNQVHESAITTDIRTIDPQILQVSSDTISEPTLKSSTSTRTEKIGGWILLIILSLIGIERWIAHSKQNAQYGI